MAWKLDATSPFWPTIPFPSLWCKKHCKCQQIIKHQLNFDDAANSVNVRGVGEERVFESKESRQKCEFWWEIHKPHVMHKSHFTQTVGVEVKLVIQNVLKVFVDLYEMFDGFVKLPRAMQTVQSFSGKLPAVDARSFEHFPKQTTYIAFPRDPSSSRPYPLANEGSTEI